MNSYLIQIGNISAYQLDDYYSQLAKMGVLIDNDYGLIQVGNDYIIKCVASDATKAQVEKELNVQFFSDCKISEVWSFQ